MFCISYYLLKRTFTIICDNDLILLPFLQKTTVWSGRIFCIGCYLWIFTSCLYCVIAFHFTVIAFVCMSGLRVSDLNKETTFTYLNKPRGFGWFDISAFSLICYACSPTVHVVKVGRSSVCFNFTILCYCTRFFSFMQPTLIGLGLYWYIACHCYNALANKVRSFVHQHSWNWQSLKRRANVG